MQSFGDSWFCSLSFPVSHVDVVGNVSREWYTAQVAASIKVHAESGGVLGTHGICDSDRHHRARVGP